VIEQRLARWLLMSHDRVLGDSSSQLRSSSLGWDRLLGTDYLASDKRTNEHFRGD
jgi:hypothetical protein